MKVITIIRVKGTNLGEFEELVLLTVGILYGNAYSVAVTEEIKRQTQRNVNVSAVHTALYRMEKKGYLRSEMGESSSKRGGKRKRQFYITPFGKQVLDQAMHLRERLRNQIPDVAFNWKING